MRTPWRFVADLVYRKPRPAIIGEQQQPGAVDIKALAHTPIDETAAQDREHVEPPASSGPDLNSSAEVVTAKADPAPEATPAIQAVPSIPEPVAPGEVEAPSSSLAKPKAAATKDVPALDAAEPNQNLEHPADSAQVAQKAAPTTLSESPKLLSALRPKSTLEEMADLDAQIAALRRELSQKLITQNTQLRKMLARFDRR
jgi:hypothetical protein